MVEPFRTTCPSLIALRTRDRGYKRCSSGSAAKNVFCVIKDLLGRRRPCVLYTRGEALLEAAESLFNRDCTDFCVEGPATLELFTLASCNCT